jgi:hypothetical protein
MARSTANNGIGFEVPYTSMGDERAYRPDFIVLVEDGHADPLQVVEPRPTTASRPEGAY